MCRSPLLQILISIALLSIAAPSPWAQNAAVPRTTEEKIANALAAGPRVTIGDATIWEWPAQWPNDYGEPRVLRHGTSTWVCIVDDPSWPGNDASCNDPVWQVWYRAYMAGKEPPLPTRVGIGYMLTIDTHTSNTDPYGEKATPENQWHHVVPHVMILFPDPVMLQGFPKDPNDGGPYVMYTGTSLAHLMVPVE